MADKTKEKKEKPAKPAKPKKEKKPAKPTSDLNGKTFKKTCQVKGKEGKFYLVRKGDKQTRICSLEDGNRGQGELVNTKDVHNEEAVPEAENKDSGSELDALADSTTT